MPAHDKVYVATITGDVSGAWCDHVAQVPALPGSRSTERIEVTNRYAVSIIVVRRTKSAAVARAKDLWVHELRRMHRDLLEMAS